MKLLFYIFLYENFYFCRKPENISFKQQYLFCYERIKIVTNKFLVKEYIRIRINESKCKSNQ